MVFNTSNASEGMRLTSAGDLLIGATTSPADLSTRKGLTVRGNGTAGFIDIADSASAVRCTISSETTGTTPGLVFDTRTQHNIFMRTTDSGGALRERFVVGSNGSCGMSFGAQATTATAGFFFLPTMAGTPTGTPATLGANAGGAPCIVDTTGSKLWVRVGATWKSCALV
jgi:hypothetical protein